MCVFVGVDVLVDYYGVCIYCYWGGYGCYVCFCVELSYFEYGGVVFYGGVDLVGVLV